MKSKSKNVVQNKGKRGITLLSLLIPLLIGCAAWEKPLPTNPDYQHRFVIPCGTEVIFVHPKHKMLKRGEYAGSAWTNGQDFRIYVPVEFYPDGISTNQNALGHELLHILDFYHDGIKNPDTFKLKR